MKNVFASDLPVLLKLIANEPLNFMVYDPQKKLINNTNDSVPYVKNDYSKADVLFIISGKPNNSNYKYIVDFTNRIKGSKFRYFNNADGTIRWVWSHKLRRPTFLSFYNSAYKTALLLKTIIKIAFFLRLGKKISSGTFTFNGVFSVIDKIEQSKTIKHFSIFTGTIGPNRKCIIELGDGKVTKQFIKIPIGETAANLVANENKILNLLRHFQFSTLHYPDFSNKDFIDVQSNIKPKKHFTSPSWTSNHTQTITSLYELQVNKIDLNTTDFFTNAQQQIKAARQNPYFKSVVHAEMVCSEINLVIQQLLKMNIMVPTGFMHGDFTPWNMYETQNAISLYDWEMSKTNMPLLFDLFHYVIQKGVLIQHYNSSQIEHILKEVLNQPEVKQLIELHKIDVDLHLKLYLIYIVSYYLNVYSKQPSLHVQVEWLMQNWLNMLIRLNATDKQSNMRLIFIQQFFTSIQFNNYRVLKHVGKTFTDYATHSDIDLLVAPTDVLTIIKKIKKAYGVYKVQVIKKSFMHIVYVYFSDGSFISIDLLTGFKRKNRYFLQASEWLMAPACIENGIKCPDLFFAFEYIILFSLLNGANTPDKYQAYYNMLSEKQQQQITERIAIKYGLKINSLNNLFHYNICHQNKIICYIKKQYADKPFQKVFHTIQYFIDTLKEIYCKKGIIMTFSGVDGAGKSTVLEEVKTELETSFRRTVVVLRHRPSILPILSVYRYGKHAAHQKAIESLPRQGKNKSTLSSLLRFAYYFTDYALGQLYIYVKHVLKGKVVLYDRYYYDFIADPQRSNIKLKSGTAKFLFRFIKTPDINFFLYAEPEVILKRKQELSYSDIQNLTEKYKTLFTQLEASKHISICNNNKQQTVQTILQAFGKAA